MRPSSVPVCPFLLHRPSPSPPTKKRRTCRSCTCAYTRTHDIPHLHIRAASRPRVLTARRSRARPVRTSRSARSVHNRRPSPHRKSDRNTAESPRADSPAPSVASSSSSPSSPVSHLREVPSEEAVQSADAPKANNNNTKADAPRRRRAGRKNPPRSRACLSPSCQRREPSSPAPTRLGLGLARSRGARRGELAGAFGVGRACGMRWPMEKDIGRLRRTRGE